MVTNDNLGVIRSIWLVTLLTLSMEAFLKDPISSAVFFSWLF